MGRINNSPPGIPTINQLCRYQMPTLEQESKAALLNLDNFSKGSGKSRDEPFVFFPCSSPNRLCNVQAGKKPRFNGLNSIPDENLS